MWLQPQGVSKLRCPYFDVTLQFLQLIDSLQQILIICIHHIGTFVSVTYAGHNPYETFIWIYYLQLGKKVCTIFSSRFMNLA